MPSVILAGTTTGTALSLTSDTSGELQIRTNNGSTTAMTLTTGGNVGIGTTAPTTILNAYNATSAFISLDGDSATQFRATRYSTDSGAPQTTLRKARGTLASPTAVATNDVAGVLSYQAYDGATFRGVSSIQGAVDNYTAADNLSGLLLFATRPTGAAAANTERMRIDSSGNVGIGTSSPSGRLQVAGNTKIGTGAASNSKVLMVNTPSGTAAAIQLFQDGNESWVVENPASSTALTFANSNVERMRITSAGSVGIGTTSPAGPLQVVGTTDQIRSGDGTTTSFLGGSGASGYTGTLTNHPFLFYTNSAERMRITSGGFVGIGNTNPSIRLQVTNGSISCNGDADAGSYKLNITSNSGADRDMLLAGVSGVTNGLQVNFINSTSSIAYRFNTILTTGSAANAHLDAGDGNRLYRSTSSLRYKKDIENIEQSKSDAVLNLRPVWYRSKVDNDKTDWSWYGLIAEEVAEVEPRLVHWSYLDSDYDVAEENGSLKKTLKSDAKLIPDGVQYERVTVLLLDVVKRQEQAIQELKTELDSVKAELQTLKGA